MDTIVLVCGWSGFPSSGPPSSMHDPRVDRLASRQVQVLTVNNTWASHPALLGVERPDSPTVATVGEWLLGFGGQVRQAVSSACLGVDERAVLYNTPCCIRKAYPCRHHNRHTQQVPRHLAPPSPPVH